MLRPLLPLVFFLLLATSGLCAETLYYQVRHHDRTIGHLRIERRNNGEQTEYRFRSKVNMQIIFDVKVNDSMNVVYRLGTMQNAVLYRTQNGKVKVNNRAQWDGRKYLQWSGDKLSLPLARPVSFSTACLYFHEPKGLTEIYSEKFQQLIAVKSDGPNAYRLQLPDGRYTRYIYQNGICRLVEAHTDWATIQFVFAGTLPDD